MSNATALHPRQDQSRQYHALVLGRAGLDLYPQPDGCKTRDADSFSADLGGSAGNIAVAMAKAGARVALITGLSHDAVGEFVRKHLTRAGVDTSLITTTRGDERTSLALAEVRGDDCEVVIYRNNPADLAFDLNDAIEQTLNDASNLVVTGTCLIDDRSRANTLELMRSAQQKGCSVWFDLDYRAWNWPNPEYTRYAYREAAGLADVLVGNEEEFTVLEDDLDALIDSCRTSGQILLLKRGADGSTLFSGEDRLDSGIYPVDVLKPYGAGDAFLGNLLINYFHHADWQQAIDAGSAAAALVVAKRGCGSAMPDPAQIETLQRELDMSPASIWR